VRGLPNNWRPFSQQSIDELEALVAHNRADSNLLIMVAKELQNRSTPRAKKLLRSIESAFSGHGSQWQGRTLGSGGDTTDQRGLQPSIQGHTQRSLPPLLPGSRDGQSNGGSEAGYGHGGSGQSPADRSTLIIVVLAVLLAIAILK